GERLAVVVEMTVGADGAATGGDVYRARVVNHAKLAYDAVAAWLDGAAPAPPRVAAVPGLDAQLRLQDRVAQAMKALRHHRGALSLETLEPRALPRSLALGGEAPRLGRVRPRPAGRRAPRTLRARRAGLHARDGAQPAIPRPHHPAPPQGGARHAAGAVHRRGARRAGAPLHRGGGQRRQGRAPGAEVGGGAAARL